ncbi:hypothetical protein HN51_051943 [Arachis hypogaea]
MDVRRAQEYREELIGGTTAQLRRQWPCGQAATIEDPEGNSEERGTKEATMELVPATVDGGWRLNVSDMGIERSGENKILGLRFTSRHKRSKRYVLGTQILDASPDAYAYWEALDANQRS